MVINEICLKSAKKVPNVLKVPNRFFFVPNDFKKCKISGIWHQKCQYGHPVLFTHHGQVL